LGRQLFFPSEHLGGPFLWERNGRFVVNCKKEFVPLNTLIDTHKHTRRYTMSCTYTNMHTHTHTHQQAMDKMQTKQFQKTSSESNV
jgi:hypothetical protein